MPLSSVAKSAAAEGSPRAATVVLDAPHGDSLQVSILPISASGTGTMTIKPAGCSSFVPALDSSGSALNSIDLSAESTHIIQGRVDEVKVQSTTGADTFTVLAGR